MEHPTDSAEMKEQLGSCYRLSSKAGLEPAISGACDLSVGGLTVWG